MQKIMIENVNKMYQSLNKPMRDMMILNIETMINLSKNMCAIEEIMTMKKPEDFVKTQLKLASLGNHEAINYTKKAADIMVNAMHEMNESFSEVIQDVATKTSTTMKKE